MSFVTPLTTKQQTSANGAIAAVVEATFESSRAAHALTPKLPSVDSKGCLSEVPPTLNHHAFGAKLEWNLISQSDVETGLIKWRSGALFLAPYLQLQLSQAKSGVIVGFGVVPGPTVHSLAPRR
ncbi:hypothetical protein ACFXP7_07745 [Microbacterium sp. P06]|uniref:hypothetical protein n=1 Tax=Microbacterium sp. P06 TaxID=3366949 RepID=UPI0037453747